MIFGTEQSFTSEARRSGAELAIAYVLILAVIWTPRPWQVRIYLIAASFVVLSTALRFLGWKAMGLVPLDSVRSVWVPAVALALSIASALAASSLHTLHIPPTATKFLARYAGYIIFAFVQQWLLNDYFLPRFIVTLRSRKIALLASATIFALAHLPNPILTVLTFIWGLAASALFLRYRGLYSLAVAHAILGITLAITVPGPVTRNMRVGLGYLTYPAQHLAQRSH